MNGSRLKGTELLRFRIVDSLSSALSKANLLGAVEIEKITDDMYMIYSADNKTATIVSEAPVRVLAEEDDALGELVNTIDFRNADLSRIKSLDNVVGKAKSTYSSIFNTTIGTGTHAKAVQHSLDEIKKINHSTVSRYKYKKPDPFNNKEADSSLSVADTLCSIWTWAWVTNWELDDIFEDFAINACASLGEAYGLYGLERQDTSYIFDLLSLNWDGVTSVDNMSYTEAAAAWAISRVLATHDLMSHLDTIVKEYNNPIYHSLTNRNIESVMEGGIAKGDVIEQLGYGDDIDGTYDELMNIIRERVCDYGKQKFSNHLETCIKYFKSTGDKKALAHFSEIYKCVKGVIDYVNNSAKNKLKDIEDGMKKLDRLLGENFNTHIKLQKSAVVNESILHYEAITDKLFTVDDNVAQALKVDKRLIGANVCIFVVLEHCLIGEDIPDDDTDNRAIQLVVDTSVKDSHSSEDLIKCTRTDCSSDLSLSNLQASIDEFREEYTKFFGRLNVRGVN